MTSYRYNNYFIIIFLRTSMCTGVIVMRLLFIYFKFWDGMQHSIPKVCQVVLSNIHVQSRIVHSYVHDLFDCSCHIISLPDLEDFHRCCVATVVLVLKN